MTGERPEAFELCKLWMAHQDYTGEVKWVIVDDGREPQSLHGLRDDWLVCYIRRQPYWQPGQNTQHLNILSGLNHVLADDRLLVIEDDDYYGPGYLSACDVWLNTHDLVGEGFARYFNLKTSVYKQHDNSTRASLCSTGMKGKALELFGRITQEGHKFIDTKLWKRFVGDKQIYPAQHVVGVKGLPGREGIGAGHRMDGPRDPLKLQHWIGDDWKHYEP